jgi:hypothetical protein
MQGTFHVEAEQLVHSAAPSSVSDILWILATKDAKLGHLGFHL